MERKGDSKFSFSTWLKDNCLYFLAFLLPVLSMLIVYFFKDIAPFGDQMYLRSDCYHQYTPYLQILQDKLRNISMEPTSTQLPFRSIPAKSQLPPMPEKK